MFSCAVANTRGGSGGGNRADLWVSLLFVINEAVVKKTYDAAASNDA
jgi:hypothetical protein